MDIKSSNVSLFEQACYWGDYGAAVKTGHPIRERTLLYYPRDGDYEAREERDMDLLAVTVIEMFGTILQVSHRIKSLTKQEIRERMAEMRFSHFSLRTVGFYSALVLSCFAG